MIHSFCKSLSFSLLGSLFFFLLSCSPSPDSFPEFEPDISQENQIEGPAFLTSPALSLPSDSPKESTEDFPEFNEGVGAFPYFTPSGFRPFVRVLIGEKERQWFSVKDQRIEIFEGDPLGTSSRKVLQSSERIEFNACGDDVCLESSKGEKRLKSPLWYRAPGQLLQTSKGEYRGLFFISNQNQRLQVINYVGLEDYIQGILPYEIGTLPDWGFEALKAQAVSARTYTLKNLKELDKSLWDLYSDTRDQVYKGVKEEYELSNLAVHHTRGLVLEFKAELAETYYHSTSGGHTANIREVWGGEERPYLRGQPDIDAKGNSWSKDSPWDQWKFDFSLDDISHTAKERLNTLKAKPELSFSQILSMKILSRNSSGRVARLELTTDNGKTIITGDKTRWLFNPKRVSILPSSWFWLEQKGKQLTVWGKGFGHGIGLCQMGARARSKAGQKFSQILEGYYPGTQIRRVPF